jgi:hypothetical protein
MPPSWAPTVPGLNYRTPRGIRVTGATPWGPVNDAGLGYMAEYAWRCRTRAPTWTPRPPTVGDDMHWYGGGRRAPDRSPGHGDASRMPVLHPRRAHRRTDLRGVDCLPMARRSTPRRWTRSARPRRHGRAVDGRDPTGYMGSGPSREDGATRRWPHIPRHAGSGARRGRPGLTPRPRGPAGARPGPTGNPQPVHTALLIESASTSGEAST